jgi:predicted enzyme related to lactoylglutathione lyase
MPPGEGVGLRNICAPNFVAAAAGNLSVTKAEPGWQPSYGTTVVLNVADCHAPAAELRRRGVRCDEPAVFPGFVTFASFFDPFGNRLQMCSRHSP